MNRTTGYITIPTRSRRAARALLVAATGAALVIGVTGCGSHPAHHVALAGHPASPSVSVSASPSTSPSTSPSAVVSSPAPRKTVARPKPKTRTTAARPAPGNPGAVNPAPGAGQPGGGYTAPPPVHTVAPPAPAPRRTTSVPPPPAPKRTYSPPPPPAPKPSPTPAFTPHFLCQGGSSCEPSSLHGLPDNGYAQSVADSCAQNAPSGCGTSGIQWGGGCSFGYYSSYRSTDKSAGWAIYEIAQGTCNWAMIAG